MDERENTEKSYESLQREYKRVCGDLTAVHNRCNYLEKLNNALEKENLFLKNQINATTNTLKTINRLVDILTEEAKEEKEDLE